MNYQKSIELLQLMFKLEVAIKDKDTIVTNALTLAFQNKKPLKMILITTKECIEDNENVCCELFGTELTQSIKNFKYD